MDFNALYGMHAKDKTLRRQQTLTSTPAARMA